MKTNRNHFNSRQGLYDPSYEHDACGVGMLVNIHGEKSHDIIESALKVLENMRHRGAEGADNKTGDGAGILLQIPHEFILLQGIPVPEKGKYGTGLIFLPKDEEQQASILSILIEEIEKEGLTLMHLRKVPVHTEILGKDAQATEPDIKQIFIIGCNDQQELELKLYLIRKRVEKRVSATDLPAKDDFYIASLSTKNIVYKGMLESMQLRHYFPDLTQPYFTSGLALVHSRFSTNTFPTWSLAQPFRLLAHNGEINTIRGNRGWMEARESVLSSPRIPDINDIRPIIQPGMSDSASLDNVLEFFVASGMSLPHAMAMLVPESFNEKNPISEDLKAFYEYHSILMEPWDGPAALLFSDGRYAGGMLDRNGLRPARYLITKHDMMVVASEVGVMDFEPNEIKEKGRLQPGKILLIDTEKGKIYYDSELKEQLANAQPYRTWLEKNRVELDELKSGRKIPHKVEGYDKLLRTFGYSREDIERIIVPMCTGGAEPVGSMGNDTPLAVLSARPQILYNYFRQQFAQVTNPPIDPIREELVMSLTEYIGAVGSNILVPTESHCKMVRLNHPILTNTQLDLLCNIRYKGFKSVKLPTLFDAEKGCAGLKAALDELCKQAEQSVTDGVNYIILSDRNVDKKKAVIPSLLAVSAVHHHLISVQKRVQTALVVETGEMREVMHAALLLGYGASAINPYMAFAILDDLVDRQEIQLNYETAEKNYVKAICKGLFKVMSKMGISTIRSYRGAKLFEAIGLSRDLADTYFGGTTSNIGGIRLEEIAADAIAMHNDAFSHPTDSLLEHKGIYSFRKDGEKHAWNPDTISMLQLATRLGSYLIAETVIRVDQRMSYTSVAKILEAQDEQERQKYEKLVPMFEQMAEVSGLLRERRKKRGAIDFDFPETKMILDEQGRPVELKPYERNVATKMIEDFMLAANETVAEEYFWREIPFLYRTHEAPEEDKVKKLSTFINNFGYHIHMGNEIRPKEIQKLLEKVEGTPQEALISRLALRSMKQARYTPENAGHFGLAAQYYTHFTSPIRRYPDLQIHRIIKENLRGRLSDDRMAHYEKILQEVATQSSEMERRAEEAERETVKLKKVEYMQDRIGEEFEGVISGITKWGAYVELPNTIEGLVHVVNMKDDHYEYREEQYELVGEHFRNVYKLGQRVRVRVLGADRLQRTIDFEFCEENE